VTDIRRIACNLRPPVLDELGLDGAIREHATRIGGAAVVIPVPLPPLPAAVEVAAYRIVVEAMTVRPGSRTAAPRPVNPAP
jgi:two-component system, NarL family, sensor kinase